MTGSLYARVLGEAWEQLAEPVRRMHGAESRLGTTGILRVEHGSHPLARLLAWIWRLPPPVDAASAQLVVARDATGEHWLRRINGRQVVTRQYAAEGSLLGERFGRLELRFALVAAAGGLVYVQRGAGFAAGSLRFPIPTWGAPRVEAREDPAGAHRVRVDVRVTLPAIGTLITYGGIMELEETP